MRGKRIAESCRGAQPRSGSPSLRRSLVRQAPALRVFWGRRDTPHPRVLEKKIRAVGRRGAGAFPRATGGAATGQRRAGLCSPFCICLVVACSLRSPPGRRRVARAQRCLLANVAPEPKIMQSLALSADECARGRGAALLHVGAWSVWHGNRYPSAKKIVCQACPPALPSNAAPRGKSA
jgi:hypothetical protein